MSKKALQTKGSTIQKVVLFVTLFSLITVLFTVSITQPVWAQTSVISNETQNMRIPLTEDEIQQALTLAFEDESLSAELKDSYAEVSTDELTTTDQLNFKGFLFSAESMPESVNELSKECGAHRCIQLVLYTKDNSSLDMFPIIDLTQQIVAQNISNRTSSLVDEPAASTSDAFVITEVSAMSDDTLISSENIQESTEALNNQPTGASAFSESKQTERMFLPIVGRNQFKSERAAFEKNLMSWWCAFLGNTIVDDWFGNVCEQ